MPSPGMQYLRKATFAQALMERTWMKEQEAKQLFLQITGTMYGQSESALHSCVCHAKAKGHACLLLWVNALNCLRNISLWITKSLSMSSVQVQHHNLFSPQHYAACVQSMRSWTWWHRWTRISWASASNSPGCASL